MPAVLDRRIQIETEHPRKKGHHVASSLVKIHFERFVMKLILILALTTAMMIASARILRADPPVTVL